MNGLKPLTEDEAKVIKEFCRTMEEEVIPEIVRVVQEREEVWQEKFLECMPQWRGT